MVNKIVQSWVAGLTALLVVAALWVSVRVPPAHYWFNPMSMVIPDTHQGRVVHVYIDRIVRRPFFMEWAVVVRKATPDGWDIVCTAPGAADFDEVTVFPRQTTLEFLSSGRCKGIYLEPGKYFVTTTWIIHASPFIGVRRTPLVSNVFEVLGNGNGE